MGALRLDTLTAHVVVEDVSTESVKLAIGAHNQRGREVLMDAPVRRRREFNPAAPAARYSRHLRCQYFGTIVLFSGIGRVE